MLNINQQDALILLFHEFIAEICIKLLLGLIFIQYINRYNQPWGKSLVGEHVATKSCSFVTQRGRDGLKFYYEPLMCFLSFINCDIYHLWKVVKFIFQTPISMKPIPIDHWTKMTIFYLISTPLSCFGQIQNKNKVSSTIFWSIILVSNNLDGSLAAGSPNVAVDDAGKIKNEIQTSVAVETKTNLTSKHNHLHKWMTKIKILLRNWISNRKQI